MDKLDPASTPAPEEIKEVREAKTTKLLGQMVFRPGMPIWEYNEVTKELSEAVFKTTILETSHHKSPTLTEIVFDIGATKDVVHRILDKKADCAYFQALNYKNAIRKVQRLQKGL